MCAYPARVHLRCGAGHALPCCHDKTRWLDGEGITELPAGIFDYNVLLEYLYVPAGLRGRPLARHNFAASHQPMQKAGAAVCQLGQCAFDTRRTLMHLQLGPSLRRGRHTALAPTRVAMRTGG